MSDRMEILLSLATEPAHPPELIKAPVNQLLMTAWVTQGVDVQQQFVMWVRLDHMDHTTKTPFRFE